MTESTNQEELYPIDFITYTENLVEFLGEEQVKQDYIDMWHDRLNSRTEANANPPSPGPNPNLGNEDPLLLKICQSYDSFDKYFRTGELGISDAVLDTTTLGRAIDELRGCEIITPDGRPIDVSFEDVFRPRIQSEDNFWDTTFELELAAAFSRHGFDVKLIEERQEGGPDICVEINGISVWVECKRKREKTAIEESYQKFNQETLRLLWDAIDIGPDSFVACISTNVDHTKLSSEEIAEGLGYIIQNQKERASFEVNSAEVDFELLDYYSGEYKSDIIDQDPMRISRSESEGVSTEDLFNTLHPSPVADMLQINPFSHLDNLPPKRGSGIGDATMSINNNEVQIRNAHIVIFDLPIDIEYWKGIQQSFNSARNNLSGFSPSIAVVDIPASRWDSMRDNDREYNGESVNGRKRLEISMKGILKQNTSINALVVTSRYSNRTTEGVERGRFGETMIHESPKVPLPSEIQTFLTESLARE